MNKIKSAFALTPSSDQAILRLLKRIRFFAQMSISRICWFRAVVDGESVQISGIAGVSATFCHYVGYNKNAKSAGNDKNDKQQKCHQMNVV